MQPTYFAGRGESRTRRSRSGPNLHRPLAWYVNEVARLGRRITEMVEPGLDPAIAAADPEVLGAYVHFPDYVVIAATT